MLAFLSPAWIDALDAAASSAGPLTRATAGMSVVIDQVVTDGDEPVRYHVVVDDGTVHVRPGAAHSPTVSFRQDVATARAIASGSLSAQRAFMTGRLRVGGDLSVLLAHGDLLSQLDDVFADVRARTDLGESVA